MRARFLNVVVAILLAISASAGAMVAAQSTKTDTGNGLVVHEWGTFTSIAGPNGSAINWRPLSGPSDLPCFVHGMPGNIKINDLSQFAAASAASLAGLSAPVRMETPVLYFYSPRDTQVDITVRFPAGLVTEWYPNAAVFPRFNPGVVGTQTGEIFWGGVRVKPGHTTNVPTEPGQSHYYAARATDAAPVEVNGQSEKFLFYRGLGGFQVPVSAIVDGSKVVVESPSARLSQVVLFENRAGRVGYRVVNGVQGRTTIDMPELTANVQVLHWDLERMLVAQGLYPREAKAMVETWKDSWFEEGTRVFYLLSQSTVDAILPLTINPAPSQVARAFVGRLEVLTPAVLADAQQAFEKGDLATLHKYGRFLEPIAWRLLGTPGSTLNAERVMAQLRRIAASNVPEVGCR